MCGICGWTGKNRDGLMAAMLDKIHHRGPDDRGSYADDHVEMGMTRLSIIDLQTGHQPMSNETDSVRLVFNGEIFNYVELRDELQKKGHVFTTHSDTETVVHAFEEYGRSFAEKLNGMFAIAVWDRDKKELLLVRDRFGVKPLYYSTVGGDIVFGSEIKTILTHPDVSREVDGEALSHFLGLRNIPAPLTAYKKVRNLRPGHLLVHNASGTRMERWYKVPMCSSNVLIDEDEAVCRIDEVLRDSVRIRMRSDVAFGAYLSGGIDSSSVVAIMSEMSSAPIKTFTLSFADSPAHKKDSYYARLISERYGTEHHEYTMSSSELKDEWAGIMDHMDQPFAGVISSYWLSRFIRKTVTVALSGDGADDLFASYGHHRLVWPISAMKRASAEGLPMKEEDYGCFRDRPELVNRLSAYSDPCEWRLAYAAFMDHEKNELLTDKGRDYLGMHSTSVFLRSIYNECREEEDALNRILYLDINTLLPNEVLCFNDMLSMAHSLEVRTPFLDYRLAGIACSLPGSMKIKGQTLKYILRKAVSKYLPKEIIDRPKEGFVLPKNTWFREGLRGMMEDTLSLSAVSAHGYLNHDYVAGLKKKFLAGDDSVTFKIWTLMVFQYWVGKLA